MSCELLTCVVTRLHIDFSADESSEGRRGEFLTMNFNIEAGKHVTEERQYRITLTAKFSEHSKEKKPIGFQVESTIVGFFKISDDVDKERISVHAQMNGVNTLYGTLRGVIMSATGTFPVGPMILKSRMPHEIIGSITPPVDSPEVAPSKMARRKRSAHSEEAGVKSAQRVLAKVREKADPEATAKRR
jgi:preprotein translocase subunit SecB